MYLKSIWTIEPTYSSVSTPPHSTYHNSSDFIKWNQETQPNMKNEKLIKFFYCIFLLNHFPQNLDRIPTVTKPVIKIFHVTLWYLLVLWKYCLDLFNPTNIYLLKINNRNTRKGCEIFSKLTTIKTPKRRQWRRFGVVMLTLCIKVFIVDFERVSFYWDDLQNVSRGITKRHQKL